MNALKWFLVVMLLSFGTASNGLGQTLGVRSGDTAKPETRIAEPETREAVRGLLAELDDKQVRELLLKRMSEEVDRYGPRRSRRGTKCRSRTSPPGFYDHKGTRSEISSADVGCQGSGDPRMAFKKAWTDVYRCGAGIAFALIWLWIGLALSLAAGLVGSLFQSQRPAANPWSDYALSGEPAGPLVARSRRTGARVPRARFIPVLHVHYRGRGRRHHSCIQCRPTRPMLSFVGTAHFGTLAWTGVTITIVQPRSHAHD